MTIRTQTVTIHLHISATDTSPEPSILPFMSDWSQYGYVHVGEKTLEITWDSDAQVAAQIKLLQDKIAKTCADAEQTANEYTGMIQSLLALPSP